MQRRAQFHSSLPISCCSPFTSTRACCLFTPLQLNKQLFTASFAKPTPLALDLIHIRNAMALGGYKRVARASLFAQQRVQKRSKTRHSEGQDVNRAQPSSNTAHKQKTSVEVAQTNSPLGSPVSQKKEKPKLSTPEKERLQASEPWNAEKQRLQNEKRKKFKKLKKRQRRQERRKQSQNEPKTKPVENVEDTVGMPKEGAALEASEPARASDILDFPIQVAEVNEGLKYDLAVKFGWMDPEDNSGSIQNQFIDSAFEDDHPPQVERNNAVTDKPDTSQELHPSLYQSPPNEYRPHTPRNSPPTQEPITPTRPIRTPDVLVVTPSRRRPSPQLEFIVTPKSSTVARAAASMLVSLKSRTARMNTQIAGFHTILLGLQNKQSSPAQAAPKALAAKVKVIRKIITAMEKHSNQVFVLELALRDLVDEGDDDLAESLGKTEVEFAELVEVYERKMRRLMGKLSPEALEKTLEEFGDPPVG
ncbi:hypothetical protein P171DRAFT_87450 [Karstenula rhodostoma CBS 690.94]|uniref:Uncharacterized protein n=1 Tax=Karstenula rhodostoma CBS 690.94 TaxID=1392251 RepID=A0A9P4P9T1_9PLEO|nr:hypothetical protein P171DRAFT_87450 [Karstenula rhodostoma CBS 690.94]